MSALGKEQVDKAFFISPIVNMEKLILDMMGSARVTEYELYRKKDIRTEFGETLSWEYLCYVRNILLNGKFQLTYCMEEKIILLLWQLYPNLQNVLAQGLWIRWKILKRME